MTADEWNDAHPVDTSVVYTPVKGRPEVERTATRSEAWTLGHGAAVVMVDGHPGGVSLEHLMVVDGAKPSLKGGA